MKKLFSSAIILVVGFMLVLSGCGKATDTSGTADKKDTANGKKELPTDPVTLRFSWWGSEERHEAFKQVIELYQKKYPNVTIEPEYGAWTGWQAKVLTEMGGKTEADIMQVNYNWVHSFGKGKNVFADLNDYKDYLDLDNWDKQYLDTMTVDKQLGAVPHGMVGRMNFAIKPIFENANIEYPATYDELREAGAIIGKNNTATGADNQYVLMTLGKEAQDLFIAQMLYNETGKVMQKDGKVQYTEEQVAKILEEYESFADANAMVTHAQKDPLDNESNPVWTSGRGGSTYEWSVGAIEKYINSYSGDKDDIQVVPYITPNEGDEPSIYVKPNLGYAVSKNSKNPEVAADFINFMFTDKEAVEALKTTVGLSANTVTYQLQKDAGMVSGITQDAIDMLDEYKQTVLDPYFEDEEVRGARITAVEKFRTGKVSAKEAAAEYISNQQEKLDKLYN